GIGIDLVMKEPLAMFATDPKLTGREGQVVLGKKSGKMSVLYELEKLGYSEVSDDQVAEILKRVKAEGIEKRGLLTDAEFKNIVDEVI
ncbi:MAG: 2-isopropylmalate synthase, partial [Spirochaetota bacterium]